jgi:hypothetical protein
MIFYIIDTFLLLPGGNQSIDAVIKLSASEGSFNKLKISQYDITHMAEF